MHLLGVHISITIGYIILWHYIWGIQQCAFCNEYQFLLFSFLTLCEWCLSFAKQLSENKFPGSLRTYHPQQKELTMHVQRRVCTSKGWQIKWTKAFSNFDNLLKPLKISIYNLDSGSIAKQIPFFPHLLAGRQWCEEREQGRE